MTRAASPAPDAKPATLRVLLRNAGQQLLRQIKVSASGVLTSRKSEYLHQLRVAVRRLRVLLPLTCGLFDESHRRALESRLKGLAGVLGPARDSDVFIADLWPQLRTVLGGGHLVEALDADWLAQRRRNRSKLRQALTAPRFGELLSQLEGYFARPTRGEKSPAHHSKRFAKGALRQRARRVRERYVQARKADDAPGPALHRLRIAIKKLRYELDFLAPLIRGWLPPKTGARLADLQDRLGRINDVATATALVETALHGRRGVQAERLRNTLGTWRRTQIRSLQQHFIDEWKAWHKPNPFR